MQLEWILSPLTQYAVIGVGLAGSLALWVAAKIEVHAIRQEVSGAQGATEIHVRDLSDRIGQLQTERENEPAPIPPAASFLQALNLTKRTQVVRMHRRGETVPSIAAALRAPRNEVELILKMERLLNSQNG